MLIVLICVYNMIPGVHDFIRKHFLNPHLFIMFNVDSSLSFSVTKSINIVKTQTQVLTHKSKTCNLQYNNLGGGAKTHFQYKSRSRSLSGILCIPHRTYTNCPKTFQLQSSSVKYM